MTHSPAAHQNTSPAPGAPPEASFGAMLRRERELRGLSADAVAKETRIRLPYIEAMESDAFSRLPGEAITRGFIRCYAQCIGSSPDQWLSRYLKFRGMPAAKAQDQAPARTPSPADSRDEALRLQTRRALAALTLLCAAGLAVIATALWASRAPAQAGAAEAEVSAPPPAAEIPIWITAEPDSVLRVEALADLDVYAERGGETVFNRKMRRGESRSYPASGGLWLRFSGPPESVSLMLDGDELEKPAPGAPAWTLRVRSGSPRNP